MLESTKITNKESSLSSKIKIEKTFINVFYADLYLIRTQLNDIILDKVFIDKTSGKNTNRPALEELLQYVRDGDTIIIHSMDRLARNLDDLRRLVQTLTNRYIKVQFIKENLIFTGEDYPMSNLLLSVIGAFAEFERALIKERQLEGIALAKQKGVYKGRKKVLNQKQVEILKKRVAIGERKSVIARDLGITREILYQYLRIDS